jgi:putative spermidine/putrescine transport system substrate-binding protein
MVKKPDAFGLSRRSLLKRGGALAVAGLAAPALFRSAHAQGTEGEVVFACNGGSTQQIFEKSIIPKFTKDTGIKVNYVTGQPADIVAKLRAQKGTSGIDISWLAGAVTYVAIDEDLLVPYDPALVPNAAGVDPKIAREKHILPIAASGNCLIWRKPVFEQKGWAAPTSWFDLWDPKYAGHTGMYGMSSTGGVEMLLQVAKELSGDYNNLDAAFAKFKELSKSIYQFFPNAGAWETALQQGDLWLGVNSYTRAIQLTQAGMPVGMILPKSGVPSHELHVGIAKGAPHFKAANAWANYLLAKDTQQMIAQELGYAPTVTGVAIPASLKSFFPDSSLSWFPDWRKVSGRFEQIVERWQREVER